MWPVIINKFGICYVLNVCVLSRCLCPEYHDYPPYSTECYSLIIFKSIMVLLVWRFIVCFLFHLAPLWCLGLGAGTASTRAGLSKMVSPVEQGNYISY